MAKSAAAEDEVNTFEGGDGSVTVDLTSVEEAAGFETIPRGTYPVTIESCEYSLSQNSGKPMWTLTCTINDGEYIGRKLFNHLSFSEKALPMTKRTLAKIAPEFLAGPFNPEEEAHKLVGKFARAKVKIETYEGTPRNRVQDLMEPSAGSSFMET